ncbi:MAG: DUF1269 domain-containing protein [Gammaproteobacteria bacterium]|nr:DUF1269 domain-containing protein [Gammaproteobacteria bacterium]
MTKRLYFMLPDTETCRVIVDELQEAGVTQRHLHAVAGMGIELEGLPKATAWQKTEFAHGLEAGIGLGGVAGFLGGLLAVTFPPAGLVLGGSAIIAGTLAGAGFGALVSGLIAKDMPSHELEAYERGIAQGKILLLVDVPKARVDEFAELIRSHHPEAEIKVAASPRKSQ